jgi:cysteine desulfurase/selenocysteine lyase
MNEAVQLIKSTASFDVNKIRQDFPILQTRAYDRHLAYLDNAATTQKPRIVIDAISNYYLSTNANVHRAVHYLSEKATHAFEQARIRMQQFVNAHSAKEIIFTRGTTEAINLIANSYGGNTLQKGDEILLSQMEHHANIVPWQLIAEKTGAIIKVIPINQHGEIKMEEYEKLLNGRTKIVGITHISNALGTINPLAKIIELAHHVGAKVVVDGAQAAPHLKIDVQKLDCDFYCISGHKMYGPTGIGILYGKEALLEKMPPYQGGGEMIRRVTFEKTSYADLPHKFEAGTPNIADTIGLHAAADYLYDLGLDTIAQYEHSLLSYATERAAVESDIRIIGTAANKGPILSFVMDGVHPHDIGTILDQYGVAVRTGHHCAMPLMQFFNLPATTRASFAFYNTIAEIDQFFDALDKVRALFKG